MTHIDTTQLWQKPKRVIVGAIFVLAFAPFANHFASPARANESEAPAKHPRQATDGSAKECQDAMVSYEVAVDGMKKARDHSEFKTVDDLYDYVANLHGAADASEMLALLRMIHAVDELNCANLDQSFTNYLMMDIVNTRHYADEIEKKLAPQLLHQGGDAGSVRDSDRK